MRSVTMLLAGAALVLPPAAGFSQEGAAPDWANKSGAVGVGGNTTLGGTNGIHVRTYVGPQFGLTLTFGFGLSSSTVEGTDPVPDQETNSSTFVTGLYGQYKLAYWQRGHLSAVLGGDVELLSDETKFGPDDKTDRSGTDILIGVGLQGEYFPTQYLSLFASAGLRVDFIGEDDTLTTGGTETKDETSGLQLDLGSQLFGQAGFTVWFK